MSSDQYAATLVHWAFKRLPVSPLDSHLTVEREEQLAQSVAAVLMALNNQLTEMAQNAEKLNRKGWKTRKASTELVCGYIGEIAKAVEKLTPSVQAEPCRAVNTLGVKCSRLGPHEAHTYDISPDTAAPPVTCGMSDPYGGTSTDTCLREAAHVERGESHEGTYSRWPVREADRNARGSLMAVPDTPVLDDAVAQATANEATIAYLRGDTDELGTPSLPFTAPEGDRVVEGTVTAVGIVNPRIVKGGPAMVTVELPRESEDAQKVMTGVLAGLSVSDTPSPDREPIGSYYNPQTGGLEDVMQPDVDPFSDPASGLVRWSPEPRPAPWVSVNPPPDHVSPSQVASGEACGLQLRLYRRDGVPEWPAWWNVGGSAVHACIEAMERQRIDEHSELYVYVLGGDPDACASAFHQAFTQEIDKMVRDAGDQFKDPHHWRVAQKGLEDEAWWREAGPKMVMQYAAWSAQMHAEGWNILKLPDGLAPEWTSPIPMVPALELELYGGVMQGRADQVWCRMRPSLGGAMAWEIMLVDPKSGHEMPDGVWQLKAYGWMLAQRLAHLGWGTAGQHYTLTAAYYNAREGRLEEIITLNPAADAPEIDYRSQAAMGMHQANVYPANPSTGYGSPCGVCAVRYACPIMARRS